MALDVELIGEEDIKVKGGIKKKVKGYKKYSDAVNRIGLIGWIKEEIEKKPERMIVVKIDDVTKEMGSEFEKAGYQIIYKALKTILFQKGIFLSMATHKDGDKTFILREVKKGDQLAPSYLFTKYKIKQEEMLETEEQEINDMKDKEEDKEEKKEEKGVEEIKRIIKEKLVKQEEEKKEKEIQEGIAMRDEMRKLKEILHGRLGKKSCMVEIFQFNWNTLTWRMIKRSSVKTYLKLLEVVMDNISTKENRYRIEFTPLYQLENIEKEMLEGEDSGKDEKIHDNLEDNVEENIKEGEIECPRCKGRNIKTWPIVQVIKTRSGDRMLRHRCTDCNETFSDEDLGINR